MAGEGQPKTKGQGKTVSPQDKVERVLKEMHIMFSQSLEVGGMPDKMIIDRAEYMNLLDRLTTGIYEMMEQYEQTKSSRMAAEREFQRNAEEIIDQANANAEDIYAASVLYTADAIGKIRALMDQTNDYMNELFVQFRRELRDQKDVLRSNESELQAQLADLTDTRKYLSVLRDINREQERKNRDLEAEREIGNQYARNLFRAAVSPREAKAGETVAPAAPAVPSGNTASGNGSGDGPEITVNRDASYFKWKALNGAEEGNNAAGTAVERVSGTGTDGAADTAAVNRDVPEGPRKVTPIQQEPEKRFPNEDSIYQQVLEDERRREAEDNNTGQIGPGEVLKNLIFGRDEE